MLVGVLLAIFLLLLGLGTAATQRRTLRRLREERYLPSDDRVYFRGQVRRRLAVSAVLVIMGAMIGWAFLSGMEARADRIGEHQAEAKVHDPEDGEKREPDPEERRFARFWGSYWIAILVLVGLIVCLATLDFWATRVYWMARYREMRADHEAKLQRDLAVYRQQKLNERMKGPRKPDDTDEEKTPIE